MSTPSAKLGIDNISKFLYSNYYEKEEFMVKWIFVFALLTIGLMLFIMWQVGLFTTISDAINAAQILVTCTTSDVTDCVIKGLTIRQ